MPYAVLRATEANLRKQITNGLNMATVQTTIGDNDKLTIPLDCETMILKEMTIDGELKVAGELVTIL